MIDLGELVAILTAVKLALELSDRLRRRWPRPRSDGADNSR